MQKTNIREQLLIIRNHVSFYDVGYYDLFNIITVVIIKIDKKWIYPRSNHK